MLAFSAVEKKVLIDTDVGMDGFIEASLPHRPVPSVVIMFPDITTGGGFAGMSSENSSL